jgi:RNA polymerase sigma factor (sigma-70 family)
MLARAFGPRLDEHAREDAYASAWAASLSALGLRIEGMTDGELHNYVFSAVTTHAGKELRRRGRKPIDTLDGAAEAAGAVADGPAESAVRRENERILRDILESLPERRRRVIMLRYAIGLSPAEICEVMGGLSPRAYRKEINRGIKDVAAGLALVETGEWCKQLAGEIQAFARGQATTAVEERARTHLSHCTVCSRAVRELSSSLYDLSLLPVAGLLAGSTTGGQMLDGIPGIFERVKATFGSVAVRASDGEALAGSIASSGGTRGGATALIAGAGAKIGALGLAGKVALGCVTATAGLATCVATGVVPADAVSRLVPGKSDDLSRDAASEPAPIPESDVSISVDGGPGERTSPDPEPDASAASGSGSANESQEPGPVIAPSTATPIEREASPEVAATAIGSGASDGGSRTAPPRADADQATAQLGTP